MIRLKDPLMSLIMRVLDPFLRSAVPWIYSFDANAIRWFLFSLTTFILCWAGRRFYTKAWSALLHKTADMNTLVALGTGAAYLYSAASTIAPGFFVARGIAPDIYFEAVTLIIGLVLDGNTQAGRKDRQQRSSTRSAATEDRDCSARGENSVLRVDSERRSRVGSTGERIPTTAR
jgi:Cu+-exporting ATPase